MSLLIYMLLIPVSLVVIVTALGAADPSQSDAKWYGDPRTAPSRSRRTRDRVSC